MKTGSVNAIILTIGDELLMGQVVDTNSAWMGLELSKAGIKVFRKISVGDDKNEINQALDYAIDAADIVLITGGLGPTKDDITKHTLCEYFDGKLITDKAVLNDVTGFFTRLNRPMLDANLMQAQVPDVCKVIRNKVGTAPGMWFEKIVNDDNKIIVSMPGVPYEMKAMMSNDVIPMLGKNFNAPFILHKTIMTAGIGESFLAEKIKDWEENLPAHMKLAYLPNLSQVRLRISASGKDEKVLAAEVQSQINSLTPLIEEFIFAYEDISLEQKIGELLKEKNKTVSTAESCTGGFIAHKITSVAGSSQWYKGSIIAYDYDAKMSELNVPENVLNKHGAVSEEVVSIMASEVRKKLNSDYSISASGIAGPGGGTPEKPVGTVWIGIATPEKVYTKKLQLFRTRSQNIEMTAVAAMDLLRKVMSGK